MKSWNEIELIETLDAESRMQDWMRSTDYIDPREAGLKEHKAWLESEIMEYYRLYDSETKADAPPIKRMLAFSMRGIAGLEKELKRMSWAESMAMNAALPAKLTDTEIYRAKEYPITSLIHPVRGNAACCPFHGEKHPSMTLKNNFAYCFVCAKSWDTIDVVMQLEGLPFPDAVKRLQ